MKRPRILAVALAVLGLVVSLGSLAEAQPKPGSIQGVVQSTCPADLAGTLVFIPGRSFVVITDSSGAFELSSVPAGTYTVRIELPELRPQRDVTGVVVKQNKTTNLQNITSGDLLTDVNNCGACGTVCSAVNGAPICTGGVCDITCAAGFGNCDGNSANGCEISLQADVNNCGSCGNACGLAVPCQNGVCVLACTDADHDGYFKEAGCGTPVDCNDNDSNVHPGAVEVCNGIDDNCNGQIDEGGVCGG
jgi:hypothetical protein